MDREDIIHMAREAGLIHYYDSEGQWSGITNEPLIEQEKNRNNDRLVEILAPFAALVATAEREACAKVCEDLESVSPEEDNPAPWCIAAAIRARGKA